MSVRWMWSLALLATAAFGCSKLNSTRCDQNSDCPSQHCTTSTKTCVPVDGGATGTGGTGGKGGGGGTAGSQGTGGTAFSCAVANCSGSTPFCDIDAGSCKGCEIDTNTCMNLDDGGTPVCVTTADAGSGATKGSCVRCLVNSDCSASTPVCVTATDGGAGPMQHTCVGCLSNSDCKGTKPICDLTSNTCMACGQDSDCANVGPDICMTDGHCATDSETIYVQNNTATCTDTPSSADGGANAGTSKQPLCSMQPVITLLSPSRDLVVVNGMSGTITGGSWTYADQIQQGQLSVVGQQNATIGSVSTPVFSMQSGTVSVRAVKFSPSASIGIKSTGGSLTLTGVTVDSCMGGGILLSGVTFDIERTTVTNNGPGPQGTSWRHQRERRRVGQHAQFGNDREQQADRDHLRH